jgi:hypothetical protein
MISGPGFAVDKIMPANHCKSSLQPLSFWAIPAPEQNTAGK